MARTKTAPVHNPEKFRRHLNQAMFHLDLAAQQAVLLEGNSANRTLVNHMVRAEQDLTFVLRQSKMDFPPIGQDSGEQEEEG